MPPVENNSSVRTSQIRNVVEQTIGRRLAGESLDDDDVIGAHPELMPELGQELGKLAVIQRAREVHQRTGSSRGPTAFQAVDWKPSPPKADLIPGYKIIGEIRHGGQGRVYQAIQESTRREVAIKIVREGPFAGPADRLRFQREIEVLAALKHPSIVAIHDSGAADGSFYFVMDYVPGLSLDEQIDTLRQQRAKVSDNGKSAARRRRALSVREILPLFTKVCDAINAAHLAGIIHRDLKPSNIRIDENGEPHVLDFGLAKVLRSADAFDVTVTEPGQFLGSLPWASPEQAEGDPARIDMRTDVYSLGVMLYHALTGRFPYEVMGSMRDVLDNIVSVEPVRPSSVAGRCAHATRDVNEEVDTIVLKCLAKQRERRYQNAGELARDLRHYLADEPIEAKRDSTAYILRKQLRRYRVPVAVAAGFVVVVIAAGIALAIQSARATHEAESSRAIEGFLVDMLGSVDPLQRRQLAGLAAQSPGIPITPTSFGQNVTVAEMIGQAGAAIEQRFAGQPELEATARETIGMTFLSLWRFEPALTHLRAAHRIRSDLYGEGHPDTLRSTLQLAYAIFEARSGGYEEGEQLARQALERMGSLYGLEHPDTLTCRRTLADLLSIQRKFNEAEQLYSETLQVQQRVLGLENRETLWTMHRWSCAEMWLGKLEAADARERRVYETSLRVLGPTDSITAISEVISGLYAALLGRSREAEEILRSGLERCRLVLGENHTYTFLAMRLLGQFLPAASQAEEKEQLLRTALDGIESAAGEAHQETLLSILHLARFLRKEGELEEALGLFRRGLDISSRTRGEVKGLTRLMAAELAATLYQDGQVEEARVVAARATDIARRSADRPNAIAIDLYACARILLNCNPKDQRDPQAALAIAQRAASIAESAGMDTTYFGMPAYAHDVLALAQWSTGDPGSATQTISRVFELTPLTKYWRGVYETKLATFMSAADGSADADSAISEILFGVAQQHGAEQAELVRGMIDLALMLLDQEEYATYAKLCGGVATARLGGIPTAHLGPRAPAHVLALGLIRRHDYAHAEAVLRSSLEVQKSVFDERDWRLATTTSVLGEALVGQERFSEAEECLLDAQLDLDVALGREDRFAHDNIRRLVGLYESWNQPQQADQWLNNLSTVPSGQ